MDLYIGEGSERFDKLNVSGDFADMSYMLGMVLGKTHAITVIRKFPNEAEAEIFEPGDMTTYINKVDSGEIDMRRIGEFITYINPDIVILHDSGDVTVKEERYNIMIGSGSKKPLNIYLPPTKEMFSCLLRAQQALHIIGEYRGLVVVDDKLIVWFGNTKKLLKFEIMDGKVEDNV